MVMFDNKINCNLLELWTVEMVYWRNIARQISPVNNIVNKFNTDSYSTVNSNTYSYYEHFNQLIEYVNKGRFILCRRPQAAPSWTYFNFLCIYTNGAIKFSAISLASSVEVWTWTRLRAHTHAWKTMRPEVCVLRPAAKYAARSSTGRSTGSSTNRSTGRSTGRPILLTFAH